MPRRPPRLFAEHAIDCTTDRVEMLFFNDVKAWINKPCELHQGKCLARVVSEDVRNFSL